MKKTIKDYQNYCDSGNSADDIIERYEACFTRIANAVGAPDMTSLAEYSKAKGSSVKNLIAECLAEWIEDKIEQAETEVREFSEFMKKVIDN